MKTRLSLVLLTLAVGLAVWACGPRTEGLDRSSLPDNVRADYDVFAHKCSKCHSLARPLNSGITDDDQWVRYVTRMRRQPGSGITPEDEQVILRFLRYYAAEQRRLKAERNAPPPAASSAAPAEGGAP